MQGTVTHWHMVVGVKLSGSDWIRHTTLTSANVDVLLKHFWNWAMPVETQYVIHF